jgi:hypothetical protein
VSSRAAAPHCEIRRFLSLACVLLEEETIGKIVVH